MSKSKMKTIIQQKPIPKAHAVDKHQLSVTLDIGYSLSFMLIVSGAICLFFTDSLHKFLPLILATLMVCLGIFDIIHGFRTGEYKERETKLTSNGFMLLILGIVIFFYKSDSYTIIGAIWGTIGLIKGSEELNKAICSISSKSPFIQELLSAVIEFTLGILLLAEPNGNLHHHIILLGLQSIVTGWQYMCNTKRKGF